MNPDKWGSFGNPEHPAFWLTFAAATSSCIALFYLLMF
jgi:hypothetical protein